jgi:hypothetical protein
VSSQLYGRSTGLEASSRERGVGGGERGNSPPDNGILTDTRCDNPHAWGLVPPPTHNTASRQRRPSYKVRRVMLKPLPPYPPRPGEIGKARSKPLFLPRGEALDQGTSMTDVPKPKIHRDPRKFVCLFDLI